MYENDVGDVSLNADKFILTLNNGGKIIVINFALDVYIDSGTYAPIIPRDCLFTTFDTDDTITFISKAKVKVRSTLFKLNDDGRIFLNRCMSLHANGKLDLLVIDAPVYAEIFNYISGISDLPIVIPSVVGLSTNSVYISSDVFIKLNV